jgi:hypothetical protein
MKVVKVSHTTKAEFAGQNQANIKAVMTELQKANHPGINYNACVSADNKTFIHTGFFSSEEDQKALNELPSFKHFLEQLKASGPEVPPRPEILSLVGTSNEFFNLK